MKLYLTRDFFLFVLVVSPQAVTVISVPFNECILLCRWIQTHTASTMLRRVFETEQITMKNCRTKTVFFPDTQFFFPRHTAHKIKQTAGVCRKVFTELFQPSSAELKNRVRIKKKQQLCFQFSLNDTTNRVRSAQIDR